MVSTKKNKNVRDELKALREIEHQTSILESRRKRIEAYLVKEAGGPRQAFARKHSRQGITEYVIKRLRRRKFMYFLLTTVAVVLIWAGLWTIAEHYVPNPWLSLGLGFLIVWLLRHYSDR